MKTLYIECNMGAAGDMLTAALLELTADKESAIKKLNGLGIPGVVFEAEESVKCGITGTHMKVLVDGVEEESLDVHEHHHHHDHDHHHDHEHHHHHHDHDHHHDHEHGHHHEHVHRGMAEIADIISGLNVSEKVIEDVADVYALIAEAESKAHGAPIDHIHFHEVGSMDAVADITAAAVLLEEIAPDRIVVSPINTGKGQVKCAHGILPVPAPATAHILMGAPTYNNDVNGELCTPTGAAILKHFADKFGKMPIMSVKQIGYGMGKKDFESANCVRAMLGETADEGETVIELNFNIDDMTGEEIGFATEKLLMMGARETFVTPVMMKKSRPGHMVTVICDEKKEQELVEAIFRNTTTIGIRKTEHPRYVLRRNIEEVETNFGSIRRKVSEGYGVKRSKYEYDDIAKIAREKNMSIAEIKEEIKEV